MIVFSAPKAIPDFERSEQMREGLKMAALVKSVQTIAKEHQRPVPKIEMAPSSAQPKIEVVKKIVADNVDLVVLGHGRYPSDAMGNVASYVVHLFVLFLLSFKEFEKVSFFPSYLFQLKYGFCVCHCCCWIIVYSYHVISDAACALRCYDGEGRCRNGHRWLNFSFILIRNKVKVRGRADVRLQ